MKSVNSGSESTSSPPESVIATRAELRVFGVALNVSAHIEVAKDARRARILLGWMLKAVTGAAAAIAIAQALGLWTWA
jgi:hypothetical protein